MGLEAGGFVKVPGELVPTKSTREPVACSSPAVYFTSEFRSSLAYRRHPSSLQGTLSVPKFLYYTHTSQGARETNQWVRCIWHRHEDQGLNPQYSYKSWLQWHVSITPIVGDRNWRILRVCWPASPTQTRFNERLFLQSKNKTKQNNNNNKKVVNN